MKKNYSFIIEKDNCCDLEELITLTKTYYKESDILSKDYLKWQYLKNPSGKPFLFVSREAKTNELAGQYLVIPIKYNFYGDEVMGTLSLNTLTHPKYQRNGLFTKMADATLNNCKDENVAFTTGFPNPNSYPGFVRKLGFSHLGDVPLLIKPLRLTNILFSYFKSKKVKHGEAIDIDYKKNNNIKELDFLSKKDELLYSRFWNKVKMKYEISTNKDFGFLKWRYFDLPTRHYKIFYYEKDNEIEGIFVIKNTKTWGFNVSVIMDFMILRDEKIASKMIKYISKNSKKGSIDFIAVLHSKAYEFNSFVENRFFKLPQKLLPQKIHFIVRKNNDFDKSEKLFLAHNWKLTFGDYDVF